MAQNTLIFKACLILWLKTHSFSGLDKCFGFSLRDQIFAQARAQKPGACSPRSLSGLSESRARGDFGKAGGRKRPVPPLTTTILGNCFLDGISQEIPFFGMQHKSAVQMQGFGAGKNTSRSKNSIDFRAWSVFRRRKARFSGHLFFIYRKQMARPEGGFGLQNCSKAYLILWLRTHSFSRHA